MVPQARQICSQRQELCAIGVGYGWRLSVARSAKLIFKTRDFSEPFIPPSFEVAGNQTILRIDRIILPVRASRFVARVFQRQLDLLQALRAARSRSAIACSAASSPSGAISDNTSADTVASMRIFPNAIHFVRRP